VTPEERLPVYARSDRKARRSRSPTPFVFLQEVTFAGVWVVYISQGIDSASKRRFPARTCRESEGLTQVEVVGK
jgi:hypothetical protein